MSDSDKRADRTEYFQGYYRDRKAELSQKRQNSYRTDPAYREKAKQAARDYRARKKKEKAKLRAEGKLPPARQRGPRKPVTVVLKGDRCSAYTVTVTAGRLGRSVDTLNYWTKAGLLPVTPLRSKRGDRLYTEGMILVMQMAIYKRGKVSRKDETFCREIIDGWVDLGVEFS